MPPRSHLTQRAPWGRGSHPAGVLSCSVSGAGELWPLSARVASIRMPKRVMDSTPLIGYLLPTSRDPAPQGHLGPPAAPE
jgi:hypothetical protein